MQRQLQYCLSDLSVFVAFPKSSAYVPDVTIGTRHAHILSLYVRYSSTHVIAR